MKGAPVPYASAELEWIEKNSHLPRADLHRRFVARFWRDDVTQANLTALCKRKGWLTGRTGQFEKGQKSWNKGTSYTAPGSEKGWFRKGHRGGEAAKKYKPIGTERLSKDGYIQRKIKDEGPMQRRWRGVHLIRWEEVNGPLPADHALKCLDGDKTNTDPSNWRCIPRAMLPRLNGRFGRGYDEAPAELKPLILATAELEHAAREARKGQDR